MENKNPKLLIIIIIFILLSRVGNVSANQLFELTARSVQSPPKIDGIIEQIWENSVVAGNFIQYEPNRGQPSEFKSQVVLMHDSNNLYIAFSLWDSLPPTAQLTRRDADLFNDDAVIVVLDTYCDQRTAYYFMTNPLATQTDGRISDDGRIEDLTWDAPWVCAAQQTQFGWTVELAIPFTSLKYVAGDSVSWGINLGRCRRQNLEISFWAGPLENRFRISQAGKLFGLNVAPPQRRQQIIPYGLTRLQEQQTAKAEAGIDIRYALTPKMSAYVTVNPDFATIEADQEQINLTRFELSLPEKRQFFIEGNELFGQRMRTFYSRRIPDITFGGKLLGRQARWNLAGLITQSEPLSDSVMATHFVARAQKDIFGSSTVAFMTANRSRAGLYQGSSSSDVTLFFTKTLGMTAQLVKSYGVFDQGSCGYYFRPAYDSPTAHFHVRYSDLGDHLAENINVVGFIPDDDRRELDSAYEKQFWIKSGWMERTRYDSNYNIYWSQKGRLRSWQIDQSFELEMRNRLAFGVAYSEEFKRFETDFQNRRTAIALGYNTREFQSAEIRFEFGRNFNSDFQLWTAKAAYKLTAQLSLEYELERLILEPDPAFETTWIHVIKADQFFTKDLYVQTFFQTNSAIDRINLQAVFVYRYQPPFGTIQLAYQRGTAEFGQRSEQGNTLFLKLTYVL